MNLSFPKVCKYLEIWDQTLYLSSFSTHHPIPFPQLQNEDPGGVRVQMLADDKFFAADLTVCFLLLLHGYRWLSHPICFTES